MALTATLYRLQIELSDVDRGVYLPLELRLARHPSETMRYLLTRTLAYCLSHSEGIAFSREGIASIDEPPIAVRDPTGQLLEWIEIGAPSADRLHRATRMARKVSLYTYANLAQLQREAASRAIPRLDSIDVLQFDPAFLDAIDPRVDRNSKLELVRTDGQLYVTVGGEVIEGALTRGSLIASP